MYWEVDDHAMIDGVPIRDYLDAYQATIANWDDSADWFAARVLVSDDTWSESRFLDIWGEDEYGNHELWDGEFGVELADGGDGRWGSGHYGTQSPINSDITDNSIFIMQIGYAHYDEDLDDSYWVTLADSSSEKYSSLVNVHTYEAGSIAPPTYTPWNPNQFTSTAEVPEPPSTILAIIGMGILAVKRKIFN